MIPTIKNGRRVFAVPREFENLTYDPNWDPSLEDFDDDTIEYIIEDDSHEDVFVVQELSNSEFPMEPEPEETVLIPAIHPSEYPPVSVKLLMRITTEKSEQQEQVSRLLLGYVKTIREREFSFNRLTLSNEAMAVADFLGYKNFVVSSDWMTDFTNKHKIKFSSPVQDVFDERSFYLLRLGVDDFYYHRGEILKNLFNN